ncbi:MAG TPA: choice-of-anchor D domain-containing protein [Terriglobales bacterium]|nr:choice-of-anchor D domain-containing protein [Terriglobales bacterium]
MKWNWLVGVGGLVLSFVLSMAAAWGQVTANPPSMNFNAVQIGSSSTQSLALSNSGKTAVTVSQPTLAGSSFKWNGPAMPITLSPGQQVMFSISFAPQAAGAASGALSFPSSVTTVHDRSGKHNNTTSTTATVSLTGSGTIASATNTTPGQLVASPGSLVFSPVQVGYSQSQNATLTNSGGSSVNIAQATIASGAFSMTGLSLPLSLGVGQSITFNVAYSPTSAGGASGTLYVSSDASNPTLAISLAGTGTAQGQLAVTPTTANFGSLTVGSSQTQKATLSATGSSVTVSSASITSPEFSLSGLALPITISAGQSVPFTLTFTPQASGAASAALSFASNAANPVVQNLTGSGTVPPSHSVSLTWNDVSGVPGYNIYRGSQSGGPYTKINPVLDPSTNYADSSVQGGQTYYYVTTSVDSSGTQSGYSNETQAVIPSP